MSQVEWVVQANLMDQKVLEDLRGAVERAGEVWRPVSIVPFSGEILGDWMPYAKNVFYACTNLSTYMDPDHDPDPGLFFRHENFSMANYWSHYFDTMLNYGSDCLIMTIQKFLLYIERRQWEDKREFFIRPDSDLKEFSGTVMTVEGFRKWVAEIVEMDRGPEGSGEVTLNTFILVAPPKTLAQEFRAYLVQQPDGFMKCVSITTYKQFGRPYFRRIDPFVDNNIVFYDWVEHQAQVYSPHAVFVMDFCAPRTLGDLKIIECGCFNWCGFYEADLDAIVRAVSSYRKGLPR